MNYSTALRSVGGARRGPVSVDWVSPAVSVCLAAERARGTPLSVSFVGEAGRYASHIGLADALSGTELIHTQGYLHGKTYSPLEWLRTHAEIHRCNTTIGTLLSHQVPDTALRRALNKIVGELHDNVASHSRGKGFCAAQVYADRIEYAIADSGCGFLRNVRSADSAVQADLAAIRWAFVRGNTSAPGPGPSPFGPQKGLGAPEVGLDADDDDAHAGWGLDELRQMIDHTNGRMWVASGAAGCTYSEGSWQAFDLSSVPWPGVFIELQVPRGG